MRISDWSSDVCSSDLAETEAVVGLEPGDLVAVADFDRVLDADEALGRLLLGHAGRLQQEHERARRAVHDRDFGRGKVDIGIGNELCRKGCDRTCKYR